MAGERRTCVVAQHDPNTIGPWPCTIVLCLDGTNNQYGDKNSNVLQLFRILHKQTPDQIVYYQSGLGTDSRSTFISRPVNPLTNRIDSAIGWNLEEHIHDAYRFLMQTFRTGHRISIFGFSRGAYTARVLTAFLKRIGLLPQEHHAHIPLAWELFRSSDTVSGLEKCVTYKETFSVPVEVDFLGLWDTVASVRISGKELPFDTVLDESGLHVFRQALSLDECRVNFTPNFKLTEAGTPSKIKVKGADARATMKQENEGKGSISNGPYKGVLYTPRHLLDHRVREVWFAGCHSDVGGGSVPHSTPNSLSRIPLRWMIRECFRMNTGIKFNKESLADVGFGTVPFTTEQLYRGDNLENPVNEKEEEHKDASSPEVDQLSKWYWWIPELWPVALRQQNSKQGQRNKYKTRVNLGRGRMVYGDAWNLEKFDENNKLWYIQIHSSVRTRMTELGNYKPKARIFAPEGEQDGYCLFVDE